MTLPVESFVVRDVGNPRGTVRVVRDNWWWCIDGDHSKAVFYCGPSKRFNSPQCNSNRAISERIVTPFDSAVLCQIPVAFVPVED